VLCGVVATSLTKLGRCAAQSCAGGAGGEGGKGGGEGEGEGGLHRSCCVRGVRVCCAGW